MPRWLSLYIHTSGVKFLPLTCSCLCKMIYECLNRMMRSSYLEDFLKASVRCFPRSYLSKYFLNAVPKQLRTWNNLAILRNITCSFNIINVNLSCAFSCFLQIHMTTFVLRLLDEEKYRAMYFSSCWAKLTVASSVWETSWYVHL